MLQELIAAKDPENVCSALGTESKAAAYLLEPPLKEAHAKFCGKKRRALKPK